MPVKNIKRKTNDGFEGVITGLNDKEKEIIANSVGSDSPKIYDIFEFVSQDYEPLPNCYEKMSALFTQGKIIGINSEEGFYLFVGEFYDNGANGFLFLKTSATESNKIGVNTLIFKSDNTLSFFYTEYLPVLPADASTKNYTLEANNGTIAWTESSGGATYTAGKNISISEANEISVADKIENINSIYLKEPSTWHNRNIYLSSVNGELVLSEKYTSTIAPILFVANNNGYTRLYLYFENVAPFNTTNLKFDLGGLGGTKHVFASRVSVPDVPTSDGTYVLKATVSSGKLTYSWVKEGE